MSAYYNEIDPFASAWLRELMKKGLIADGIVDERSITEVKPEDLKGFTQCHFFAGIGVWSYALRQAGWADDRPVWTGSCPCQPFSSAGKNKGFDDERHLWPAWYKLIEKCRPSVIFGEQVSAAAGSGLQRVSNGAGHISIPPEWEGRLEMGVQGVLRSEEIEEPLPGESLRIAVQKDAQGEGFNSACEAKGREEVDSFRSRYTCGRDTEEDRSRFLRSNWPSFQPRQRKDLGQPFFGQNNTGSRICLSQHTDSMPRCKQCNGGLGRAKDSGYGEWNFGEKNGDVEQSFEKARRMLKEENISTWLQLIQIDLGRSDYTVGSCVAPAAGVGAPHIRQRLYWVANAIGGRQQEQGGCSSTQKQRASECGVPCRMAHAAGSGRREELSDAGRGVEGDGKRKGHGSLLCSTDNSPGPTNGFWRDADWLLCRDGKWRATQSLVIEMADGLADRLGYSRFGDRWSLNPLKEKAENRVGRLRGYGNAINAEQAKAFIEAFMEIMKIKEQPCPN